jgi:hypothetical protein
VSSYAAGLGQVRVGTASWTDRTLTDRRGYWWTVKPSLMRAELVDRARRAPVVNALIANERRMTCIETTGAGRATIAARGVWWLWLPGSCAGFGEGLAALAAVKGVSGGCARGRGGAGHADEVVAVPRLGLGTTDQRVPFHDSIRALLKSCTPTAVHAVAEAHDTLSRTSSPEPGLGWAPPTMSRPARVCRRDAGGTAAGARQTTTSAAWLHLG